MKHIRLCTGPQLLPLAIAFTTLSLAASLPAGAAGPGSTATIAISGQAAPDGNGSFSTFSNPLLNQNSEVAFRAGLTGTSGGTTDNIGIWRSSGSTPTRIVRTGDGLLRSFTAVDPDFSFNDLGQVAFSGTYFSNSLFGSTTQKGIWRGNGIQTIPIVREGDAVPGGNGNFAGFSYIGLNNNGQVAFKGGLTGTSGGSADDTGIWRGSGGALTTIVREGQYAPDGGVFAPGIYNGFARPALNDSGQVAFFAEVAGSTSDTGIWRGSGGTLTTIVQDGQAPPDGNGSFADNPNVLFIYQHKFNDKGQVAFFGNLRNTSGGSSDSTGIWRGSGGALTTIVRAGQTAPNGSGQFGGPSNRLFDLNNNGQVAFLASVTDTSGGRYGIWRGSGGPLTTIVREDQVAPDSNGSFLAFKDIDIGNGGQVAFVAELTGTIGGTSDDVGIYLGDGVENIQVAREGDALAGSLISFLNPVDTKVDLNNFGQVSYRAELADGREGIFLFTPDLHYRSGSNGSWDTAYNWTLSLMPGRVHEVFIDPDISVTVFGPGGAAEVKRLEIGGGPGIATLWLNGGNLAASNGVTVTSTGVLTGDGVITGNVVNRGTVQADNVTVTGTLTNEGIVTGTGRVNTSLFNEKTGQIRAGTGDSLRVSGTGHVNAGRIEALGGEIEFDGDLTNVEGLGNIVARNAILRFNGGLLNQGGVGFSFGTSDVFGNIDNQGTVVVSGAGNVTFYDDYRNNGITQVSAGAAAVFFGTVSGAGTYTGTGTLFFEGDLAPGNSPALVDVEGNMVLGLGSYTTMELGGLQRGIEYDAFDVGGNLSLGGTLDIDLIDLGSGLFQPKAGDVFDLFTAENISGSFLNLLFPALDPGLQWEFTVLADAMGSLDIARLSVSAVPVPPAAWLFGSGLAGLAFAPPRRRSGRSRQAANVNRVRNSPRPRREFRAGC